jgi:hypothetical protein
LLWRPNRPRFRSILKSYRYLGNKSRATRYRSGVVTHEGEGLVDEMLNHERVEIDRVPIGRPVDAIPPVRQEGETAILPVVEEIIIRTPPYS